MRIFQIILICLLLLGNLQAQNRISEIQGCWVLDSPKDSPGPEFIAESYKGITHIVVSGEPESWALGQYNKEKDEFEYSVRFVPEWDGKKLTGEVTSATGININDMSKLKISIPLEFNSKKNTITININNPEYGDVKFIYKKVECDDKM